MKKSTIIINALLTALIIAGDVLYITIGGLLIKSITSSLFVLLGLFNLIVNLKNDNFNLKFTLILVIGLFFAMLGDIILEINFIIGALLFAVGHIFFFVSYCMNLKFKLSDLIAGVIIFIPFTLFILFAPIFDFGGLLMQAVCIIYTIIISCMLGKSIINYVRDKSPQNLILLIGSALFTFSDFMLLLNVFANLPRVIGILCLVSYYPAEALLALSPSFKKNSK